MPSFAAISTQWFGGLRDWLPRFLTFSPGNFDQPLLDNAEILDLQRRVFLQQAQLKSSYDTAHQHMGDTRSAHRGYGLDYEESRPYQPGDEPRYMNWQLTARTGELYMKVFREERRPGIFVVVDRRSAMRFGTRTRLKAAQAARVATYLAFAAQQNHTSVGGAILNAESPNPCWIREAGGEQSVRELIHAASAACPPVFHGEANSHLSVEDEPDFSNVLNMLQVMLVPGSTLYLISDFIDLREQHRARLMQLATENRVHAIHIFDPAEKMLPQAGRLRFQISGEDRDMNIDTDAESIVTTYKDAARNHFALRKRLFHTLNINYTQISTMSDAIETELLAL